MCVIMLAQVCLCSSSMTDEAPGSYGLLLGDVCAFSGFVVCQKLKPQESIPSIYCLFGPEISLKEMIRLPAKKDQ